MKFFITGNLQSKRGPRLILALALFMLLLFVIVHAIREGLQIGYSIAAITKELYTATKLNIITPLSIIEDLHINLLLFAMVLLLIGGLLYHLPLHLFYKHFIFFTLNLLVLVYLAAKITTHFYAVFAVITLVSGVLLYVSFIATLLTLFVFLFIGK